jgi:hypothetical protein
MEFTEFEKTVYSGRHIKQSARDTKFWDGILAFLLLKRTDEQLDRLLMRLSECSCRKYDANIRRFHKTGLEWEEVTMSRMHIEQGESGPVTPGRCSFIINIFCALSTILRTSGLTSVAKGTMQHWPLHATDLIPYGADNFVESMLQWHRFVPDTMIFQYTGLVLHLCVTSLIPSLVKYRFSHVVVESCRQLVDLTMADFTKDLNGQGRNRLSMRFKFRVLDYSVYFRTILLLNSTTPPNCCAELMRGCETKAMQLCSLILYLSSNPKMPPHESSDVMNQFVWFAQLLFRFFRMHLYPRPNIPVHPLVESLDSQVFLTPAVCEDPKYTALMAIQTLRSDRHCSAYKCPNSFQSVGKNFQRCSRCQVVSYCGRECQTNAWKDQKYPHKQICSVLRSLMSRGGGPAFFFGDGPEFWEMTHRVVYENWKKAGVQEDELSLIGDWHKAITGSRGYPIPDGTEWTPGYDDYNEIIAKLSEKGRGPKGIYHFPSFDS